MGLKLLQCFGRVIYQGETSSLAATELRLETKNVDLLLVGFVEFGELASEVLFGDIGTVRVEDITVSLSEFGSSIKRPALQEWCL